MALDVSVYERQRRGVNDSFASDSASNQYSRFLSQQRGTRDQADMTRGFGRQFPSFAAQFGKRGLSGGGVQSGIQKQATTDFVGDHTRNFGRLLENQAQDMRQHDLRQSQLQAYREQALADIEAQKARDVALAALNIQSMRDMLGGM
jgi:hypothetical protein